MLQSQRRLPVLQINRNKKIQECKAKHNLVEGGQIEDGTRSKDTLVIGRYGRKGINESHSK